MVGSYAEGVSLDPFQWIKEVNWSQDRTILDFVHDKYIVKGRRQTRAQVLHADDVVLVETPIAVPGVGDVPFEGVGLDLRGPVDSFGMPTRSLSSPLRIANLRNKVDPPTKASPGALNEFTYLDYTIVIEFDWFNIEQAFYARQGGFSEVTGGYQDYELPFESRYTRTDEGSSDGWFVLQQTLAREDYSSGETRVGENDYDFWEIVYFGENGLIPTEPEVHVAVAHTNVGGTPQFFAMASPLGSGTQTWYIRQTYYQYGEPPGASAYNGNSYIGPTGSQPPVFQAGRSSRTYSGGGFTHFNRPSLQVFDERLSDAPPSFGAPPVQYPRNVPGGWGYNSLDSSLWFPKHPGYEVPYGRVRVAANVAATQIATAMNGGDVQVKTQASRLQIPRLTPLDPVTGKRQGWFPVRSLSPFVPGASFRFLGFIRVRYVQLYRKRKTNFALKKLSIVPARIPKWWAGTKEPT